MKTPIRILSVDGGGVGGIIPARVLERLNAVDPRLILNADLVAGTSTGGLIALGLARGLTLADLCRLYQDKAKDIFSRVNRRYWAARFVWAKFDPVGLRETVEAITGRLTLGDLTAKHVLVPITAMRRPDKSHQPAGIFLSTAYRLTGNSELEKYVSSRWKCVDVGLATAAAPTYFPAHEVDDPAGRGQWICWDGGVVANNPSLAAVGEILRLDLAERKTAVRQDLSQLPDIRVLSLGTGYRDLNINAGDKGLIQSAKPVIKTLLDASVGSTAFLLRQMLGQRAVRVSVPLEEDYDFDDPGVMDRLNQVAIDFADNHLGAVRQPDGTQENLHTWLNQYWYSP